MGGDAVGLFDFSQLIREGGVIAGVVVAFLFASKLLTVFTPIIQDKMTGGKATKSAAPSETPKAQIASDETIRAHLTRTRCVPEDVDLRRLAAQVDDLYQWHKTTDPTGAFPWKISPVLHSAIESLAQSNRQIASLLERVIAGQGDVAERLDRLERRMHKE